MVLDRTSLVVQANLVFFYYRDLAAAQQFYQNILGLELVLEQDFWKMFQTSPSSYVGLVDEKRGMHRASDSKAVTLSFITEQVDEWYNYLVSKGVRIHKPLRDSASSAHRGFVALDPEGYFLEFERFLEHHENEKLLSLLKKRY